MTYKNEIIKPAEGWKEHTVYLVVVKMFERNPEHKALFYSGFLNGPEDNDWYSTPGSYNAVWHPGGEAQRVTIDDVWHMSVVREVLGGAEWKLPLTNDQVEAMR